MHNRRSETTFGNWTPFKNDEKCFLFDLRFEDIQVFVFTF